MNLCARLILFAVLLLPASAFGDSITYSMTSGTRSATAEFVRSGTNLVITLSNTSSADAMVPTDILTGIFFDIDGNPALTPVSAELPLSSSVLVGNSGANATPLDRVVGGEWGYAQTVAVPPNNGGVSSSGLGVFGSGDLFPGGNLQGPASPDGLQYGLTSAGDNMLTGNGGLSGQHLIRNSVVLTLSGFAFEPDAVISSVAFQYGTDLSEPRILGIVPEPGSFALASMAAAAAWVLALRRRVSRR